MGLLDVFVSAGPARTRRAGPFGRLLRPPACLACGAADAWPCCAACLRPEPAGAGPWRLAADPALAFWTLGLYQGPLRAAVLAGKFRGQPAALAALGRHLGSALLAAGVGADLVTWIASRPARGLPRDHARQIAAGIAAALDLPLLGLLTPNAGKDLGRARNALRERPGPPAVDDGTDRTLARPAGGPPPAAAGPPAPGRWPHPARRRCRHHRQYAGRGCSGTPSGRRPPGRRRRPCLRFSSLRIGHSRRCRWSATLFV